MKFHPNLLKFIRFGQILGEIEWYLDEFECNLSDIKWSVLWFRSNILKFTQIVIHIHSILPQIESTMVKQMTGHLNDWTHNDLYEV